MCSCEWLWMVTELVIISQHVHIANHDTETKTNTGLNQLYLTTCISVIRSSPGRSLLETDPIPSKPNKAPLSEQLADPAP